jgi:signal transduction histidine kinase
MNEAALQADASLIVGTVTCPCLTRLSPPASCREKYTKNKLGIVYLGQKWRQVGVLVSTRFHEVMRQVQHLLGCGSAHVILGCPIPELRHPLLDKLSVVGYSVVAESGTVRGDALLQHEHIRALCDVSLYKGHLSASSAMQWTIDGVHINSIAAAPLEISTGVSGVAGTSGVIGLIVCTDPCPDAFFYGERLLLQSYLPQVAELLAQNAPNFLSSVAKNQAAHGNQSSRLPTPRKTSHRPVALQTWSQVVPQLQGLDPPKNEFISMLSHEMRSPLTAIKGYAILLQAYGTGNEHNGNSEIGENGKIGEHGEHGSTKRSEQNKEEELTPSRQREYLNIIMEQTDHLEVLMSDLLDLSRLQAGRLTLRYTQVNMIELCQRAIQVVQQHANQQFPHRYIFRCTLAPGLPQLWTDAHRMRQILTNLLENAVKYSPEGGTIEMLVSTESIPGNQDMFAITIRDDGIGIPLHQQPHLFEPFNRLEHPLTHDVPGAGLGLYITHKLVEAMSGRITLQSSEGKGTSITCLLPIKQPEKVALPENNGKDYVC